MEIRRICDFLLVFIFVQFVFGQNKFDHNVKQYREDTGEEVTVQSFGKTRGLIDLDDKAIVKRILCKEMLIKVSLNNPKESKKWRPGDIVVGSSNMGCDMNSMHPERPGVFAKVWSITQKGENRVDLKMEHAHPLDIIEDAKISVHVNKDHKRAAHSVRKRSATNFLSQPLDTINWNENISTSVKFNKDQKKFTILKNRNQKLTETIVQDKSEMVNSENSEFSFTCDNCLGETSLSYHLEIEIHRDLQNNKPIVKRYISQVHGISTNNYKFAMNSSEEFTLTNISKLWETEPVTVTVIELARFKKFPPLQLTLNTSTEAYLGLYAASSTGNTSVEGFFETDGEFVISKEYPDNGSKQQASLYNWRTISRGQNDVVSNSTIYFNINVSHVIHVHPYIAWKEKDVFIDFASNFSIRLDQGILATSTKDVSSFDLTLYSNVTGDFNTVDNKFLTRAFGLLLWDQLLTPKQDQLEAKMTDKTLNTHRKANCFRSPLNMESENTTMEGVCGSTSGAIHRADGEFQNLRKIYGDFILFADKNFEQATWCATVTNNCTSCDNYEVNDNVCAERLMTSSMASAVTRLANYMAAEWSDRKLVILEAFDEPTSSHPNRKHGDSSLFSEGRAVRIGVSKTLTSITGEPEVDSDAQIILRLKELLTCAGFAYANEHLLNTELDVCLSQEDATSTTYSRRKRRSTYSNNMAISDNYKEEVEEFAERMRSLGVSSTKINTANFFATDNVYPPGATALEICTPNDEDFKRENTLQMRRVTQYPFDNIKFDAEGPANSFCGSQTRQCQSCSSYKYSDDPWDWCGLRVMSPRLITRTNRLAQLVARKSGSSSSSGFSSSVVPSGWTKEEYGVCRSGAAIAFQTSSECKNKMPDSSTESTKCEQCLREARCCIGSGNDNLGCMQSDCDASNDDSIWRGITCRAVNPFSNGASIPSSPACNSGNDKKMVLYGNVCSGDPCQFFNGREYYMLLKVVMIFEVCSGLWNEDEISRNMNDVNIADDELMTFFRSCISNGYNVLKLHREDVNDPTIGIGYSLQEVASKPTEKKDRLLRILPNVDYDGIMDKTKSLTQEQALYLYGVIMREYIRTVNSVVPFEKFVYLPLNVRIAVVNANYRGEWAASIKRQFKAAVEGGRWAEAKSAYMTHSDYRNCGNSQSSICTRMKWNAAQFDVMINTNVNVINKGNRRKRSTSSTSSAWFDSLHDNGRATAFELTTGSSLSTTDLANMAVLAGFDHVTKSGSHIEVCAKPSSGFVSRLVQYPSINLHAADPPTTEEKEYLISKYAPYSLSYPLLLDGYHEDIPLSPCYKISDVKSRNFRYFRFDSRLLQCLEEANEYYGSGSCIRIIPDSGYRVHTINNDNMDDRHKEERAFFTTGQAVEVTPPNVNPGNIKVDELKTLAVTIMHSCIPTLILKRLKLGIGSHRDRLYVDIRKNTGPSDYVQVWNVNNDELYSELLGVQESIEKGGPFIRPTNKKRACKDPPLGTNFHYIKHPDSSCRSDSASSFCRESSSDREKAGAELTKRLVDAAGSGQLSKSTAKSKVDGCLVNKCGGCVGGGQIWTEKTKLCLDMIDTYIEKASTPFPNMQDTAAFFNVDNGNSHVHSLACHDNVCIENVTLHSTLVGVLDTKFKPDTTKSNEELIFDPGSNPSPVLHLLEQIMAMHVKGNVSIFIEKDTDMSGFYQIIKILMVYNRDVNYVNFHLVSSVKMDSIIASIQRKIERWSSSVCPERSRMVVAPYTVQLIPEERRKRSVERSEHRNRMVLQRKNWEINWLMTMT